MVALVYRNSRVELGLAGPDITGITRGVGPRLTWPPLSSVLWISIAAWSSSTDRRVLANRAVGLAVSMLGEFRVKGGYDMASSGL